MRLDAVDNVHLTRYVLDTVGVAAAVRAKIIAQSDLPAWVLSTRHSALSSLHYLRLWELVEHELDDRLIAVRTAADYEPGQLGLHDHLMLTAPSLGAGLALTDRFVTLCSTNHVHTVHSDSDPAGYTTVDFELIRGEGRGGELAMQTALCGSLVKMRKATGQPVTPLAVHFRQSAPADRTEFIDLFGTDRIDFGMPSDRIVLRSADAALPMRRANAARNRLLQQRALRLGQLELVSWAGQVQQELAIMLTDEPVSIDAVARRLLTSRRTLQRHLASEGTSWRQEVERARRHRAAVAPRGITADERARRAGYSDSRSLRRAAARWRESAK
ncbi:AraC family transcriptional regulator ligand-binding domain-containing protein [Nocardia stercoris]|uniref:AraC family transcriptional regulator n=1 Tax=Nocardia stercoris TaxID=2483361 RepID=A0A3M2L9J9_9NOCA|nr:AraC family transcriptional regulator ligand-binding domain-containing protein [Nocardia stercoris]RMI31248.1 AraC family transcriptional regulator [Nocardia stercoris]